MIYHLKSILLDNVSETVSACSISVWCVEVQSEITSPNDNGVRDSIQNVRYLLHFLLVYYLKKLQSIQSPWNLKILFNVYLWLIYKMQFYIMHQTLYCHSFFFKGLGETAQEV